MAEGWTCHLCGRVFKSARKLSKHHEKDHKK